MSRQTAPKISEDRIFASFAICKAESNNFKQNKAPPYGSFCKESRRAQNYH